MRCALTIFGLVFAAVAVGCGHAPYNTAAIRGETYTVNSPHVVLDTPPVVAYRLSEAAATDRPGARPWWMSRNDGRLNVREGANTARYSFGVVEVRDYQRTTEDDVRDYHRRRFTGVQIGPVLP